jgi:hypothetical protein
MARRCSARAALPGSDTVHGTENNPAGGRKCTLSWPPFYAAPHIVGRRIRRGLRGPRARPSAARARVGMRVTGGVVTGCSTRLTSSRSPIVLFRVRRACCRASEQFPYYVVFASSLCPHSWGDSLSGKRSRRRTRSKTEIVEKISILLLNRGQHLKNMIAHERRKNRQQIDLRPTCGYNSEDLIEGQLDDVVQTWIDQDSISPVGCAVLYG